MADPAATASVIQRLERFRTQGTASERSVASYMLGNLNSLPFETSASLAAKLGLSETTVGRFCRHLGFRHFKDLKQNLRDDLGDSPWLMGSVCRISCKDAPMTARTTAAAWN